MLSADDVSVTRRKQYRVPLDICTSDDSNNPVEYIMWRLPAPKRRDGDVKTSRANVIKYIYLDAGCESVPLPRGIRGHTYVILGLVKRA